MGEMIFGLSGPVDTLTERQDLVHQLFADYDARMTGELTAEQLQLLHADMRLGGISLPQVLASIEYVCLGDICETSELFDILQEMDRRYFLVQNLRWEFSMLDVQQTNTIPEAQAKWLTQVVHGNAFSHRKWDKFLMHRAVPSSGVSFAEIEVLLCNIPSIQDISADEDEERKEAEERARKQREMERLLEIEKEKRRKQREEERKRWEAEQKKKMEEEDKRRKEEEADRERKRKQGDDEEARRKKLAEDEERGRLEAEERAKHEDEKKQAEEERQREELLEAQRLKELEERHRKSEEERRRREEQEAKGDEMQLKLAMEAEAAAEQEAEEARKRLKDARDGRTKKEAEDAENEANLRAREARNKRIRYNLKVAVKMRDLEKLPKAVADFKAAKLPDDDKDLEKGERILREAQCRDDLVRATGNRNLKELEGAINTVKRSGFEVPLARELIEANKVLLQLRRLERIRAEILELKQSTVAEIRSYQKPPPIVHTVMQATFLILGHPEKETKDWKTVQALVGKTGKDGLKRRCLGCEPDRIVPKAATRAKEMLSAFGLDDVRDVSAGAATFYVWCDTMIEELEARIASGEYDPNAPTKAEKEEAAKKAAAAAGPSRGRSTDRKRSKSVDPKQTKKGKPDSGGPKPPDRSKSTGKS